MNDKLIGFFFSTIKRSNLIYVGLNKLKNTILSSNNFKSKITCRMVAS